MDLQIPPDHIWIHLHSDLPGVILTGDIQTVSGLDIAIKLVIRHIPSLTDRLFHDLHAFQKSIFHLYNPFLSNVMIAYFFLQVNHYFPSNGV